MDMNNATTMHPEFIRFLTDIAAKAGQTVDAVAATWRKYTGECRDYDQSPISGEFVRWYYPTLENGIALPFTA